MPPKVPGLQQSPAISTVNEVCDAYLAEDATLKRRGHRTASALAVHALQRSTMSSTQSTARIPAHKIGLP